MKKHTEETKKLISEKRKAYLQANKNQHPWSRFNRNESQPERIFRESLIVLGIDGYQNYTPIDSERNFEIDFALPDKKIGFEVNGQQHYESNGSLKEYYQKRHDYINSLGWTLHEIHYSECLYIDKTQKLITNLLKGEELEYSTKAEVINYREVLKKLKQKFCLDCKKPIFRTSTRCRTCSSAYQVKINIEIQKQNQLIENQYVKENKGGVYNKEMIFPTTRKAIRPSKEELEIMIWEMPMKKIGKNYKVSDTNIKKWCKSYGITEFPGKGYWRKIETNSENFKPIKPLSKSKCPPKAELEVLAWKMTYKEIGKIYQVSESTIGRWFEILNIDCPKNGHWQKVLPRKPRKK